MTTRTQISPRQLAIIRAVDRLAVALAQHWLLYVNTIVFAFMGLPFVPPVLMHLGLEGPARLLYSIYSLTCHQLAYRSWFFFGAQPSYTVAQLQASLGVNHPATDILYWRDFLGNSQLGYKMAYCERDVAIYGSILVAGLVFAVLRNRIKSLNWKLYVLIAILPMAIDGGTQLVMLRESTPLLRTITGILFGALSVWLMYPYVDAAMKDTYAQSVAQLQRISQRALNPSGE